MRNDAGGFGVTGSTPVKGTHTEAFDNCFLVVKEDPTSQLIILTKQHCWQVLHAWLTSKEHERKVQLGCQPGTISMMEFKRKVPHKTRCRSLGIRKLVNPTPPLFMGTPAPLNMVPSSMMYDVFSPWQPHNTSPSAQALCTGPALGPGSKSEHTLTRAVPEVHQERKTIM